MAENLTLDEVIHFRLKNQFNQNKDRHSSHKR